MKRATSADVARLANVSRSTVSFVLNNVPSQTISEPTRVAVLEAARKLDYRPNLVARSLVAGTNPIIVCVVPRMHLGELSIVLVSAITTELSKFGYALTVYFESDSVRPLKEIVRDVQPAGVFCPYPMTADWGRRIASDVEIHTVGVESMVASSDAAVGVQIGRLAAKGHTRLGYASVAEPGLELMTAGRLDAAGRVCAKLGLAEPDEQRFDPDGENAVAIVTRWHQDGVTGVVAYNDEVALIVQHGIRRAGLRCPEDVAVIGLDAIAIGKVADPPLTTVEWHVGPSVGGLVDAMLAAVGDARRTAHDPTEPLVSLVSRDSA